MLAPLNDSALRNIGQNVSIGPHSSEVVEEFIFIGIDSSVNSSTDNLKFNKNLIGKIKICIPKWHMKYIQEKNMESIQLIKKATLLKFNNYVFGILLTFKFEYFVENVLETLLRI